MTQTILGKDSGTLADLHEVALAFGFAPQTLRVWYFGRVKRAQQLVNRQRALCIRTMRKKIENP